MTGNQQRLVDFLGHILEAISRINRYTGAMDITTFLRDDLVQDAVIRISRSLWKQVMMFYLLHQIFATLNLAPASTNTAQ